MKFHSWKGENATVPMLPMIGLKLERPHIESHVSGNLWIKDMHLKLSSLTMY